MFKKIFKIVCKVSLLFVVFMFLFILSLNYLGNLLLEYQVDWFRTFPQSVSTFVSDAVATPDGGVVIAGDRRPKGFGKDDYHPWLMKLDGEGELVWERNLRDLYNIQVNALAILSNGNVVLAGGSRRLVLVPHQVHVKIMDSNGRDVSYHKYGETDLTYVHSVLPLPGGGFMLAGGHQTGKQNTRDAWLTKIDNKGKVVWSRTYGGYDFDQFRSIRSLTGGSLLLGGTSVSAGASHHDLWLVKMTMEGDVIWQKTIKAPPECKLYKSLAVATNGDLILYGKRRVKDESQGVFFATGWLIRMDSQAHKVFWSKAFDIEHFDETPDFVAATPNGNLLVGGLYLSDRSVYGAFVLCLTGSGDLRWDKKFGGKRYTYLKAAAYIPKQSIILSGSRTSYGGEVSFETWVGKLTNIQTPLCSKIYKLTPQATVIDVDFKTGKLKKYSTGN